MELVLASASPRRRELLKCLITTFRCEPTHIDESVLPGESPVAYVARVAREKAWAHPDDNALILAADTTVALDNQILGKPVSYEDAEALLAKLSGREHWVHTAVVLRLNHEVDECLVTTAVRFSTLSPALIARYLATDEPWDKAGAYGIQGYAGSFVSQLSGSYSAVVGLPLAETRQLLEARGVTPDWNKGY